MKKLILLIILIAILIFVIKYMSNQTSEDEEPGIAALEKEFKSAQMQLLKAERSAGLSGMDTTSEAQMAINAVKRIKEKLMELKDQLTSEEDIKRAEDLEEEIDEFMRKNRI